MGIENNIFNLKGYPNTEKRSFYISQKQHKMKLLKSLRGETGSPFIAIYGIGQGMELNLPPKPLFSLLDKSLLMSSDITYVCFSRGETW